jgi:hypothetical protein
VAVRIVEVRHQAGAAEDLSGLPRDFVRAIYDRLEDYAGQDHPVGHHVDHFVVDARVVSVNGFVDVDGTFWVDRLRSS